MLTSRIGLAILGLTLCAACGHTPAPASHDPISVTLRERPSLGEHYVTQFRVDVDEGVRTIREHRRVATTVIALDERVTYEHSVHESSLSLLHPRIVIPPRHSPLAGATLRQRRDMRDPSYNALEVIGGTDEQTEAIQQRFSGSLFGSSMLPTVPVNAESEWSTSEPWQLLFGPDRDELREASPVRLRITHLTPTHATITFEGAFDSQSITFTIEGELQVNLANALIHRLSARATESHGGAPARRYSLEQRTDYADRAPPNDEVSRPVDVPRSRVFEGASCEARITQLERRMALIPDNPLHSLGTEVPVVEGGRLLPRGPRVELRYLAEEDGKFIVEGTRSDIPTVVESLERVHRNLPMLSPSYEGGPLYVVVFGEPESDLARLRTVMQGLDPERFRVLLVVRDPRAATHPTYADGTPAPIQALAEQIERHQLGPMVMGACTPLVEAWFSPGRGVSMRQHLETSIPPALRECNCGGTDVDLLDALLTDFGNHDFTLRVLQVPFQLQRPRLPSRATLMDLANALVN